MSTIAVPLAPAAPENYSGVLEQIMLTLCLDPFVEFVNLVQDSLHAQCPVSAKHTSPFSFEGDDE